jgi:hypothetical protein
MWQCAVGHDIFKSYMPSYIWQAKMAITIRVYMSLLFWQPLQMSHLEVKIATIIGVSLSGESCMLDVADTMRPTAVLLY